MLKKENQELTLYYQLLEGEVSKLNYMMGDLQQRDDNLYRIIFESEPIPDEMRNAGVGGSDRYKEIKEKYAKTDRGYQIDKYLARLGSVD